MRLYRQYWAGLAPLAVPYAGPGLNPEAVVAAAIALCHGLTLQWHTDPGAFPRGLVAHVLRAPERCARAAATDPPVNGN